MLHATPLVAPSLAQTHKEGKNIDPPYLWLLFQHLEDPTAYFENKLLLPSCIDNVDTNASMI